jgi:hypothetical protein
MELSERAGVRGRREPAIGGGLELGPASAYEAVTRQMVEALTDELREIRLRLNNLVYMLAGAIVLDVVIRLAGI